MKTAVKILAKPIQVKIANLPSVRILDSRPVAMAATSVQTMEQPLPFARILRPCDNPTKPEPVAKLYFFHDNILDLQDPLNEAAEAFEDAFSWSSDSHPRQ